MLGDDSILLPVVKSVLATWRSEAAQRKRRFSGDPLAEQAESFASELESEVKRALSTERTLTVEQYARSARTTPTTVRRWIQRGELEAEKDDTGTWRIPRSARRNRKRGRFRVAS